VAAAAKWRARIKGNIKRADAMRYLQRILEIVKAAGYEGLMIVVDEVETLLRQRKDVRGKSLNAIRQICDQDKDHKGSCGCSRVRPSSSTPAPRRGRSAADARSDQAARDCRWPYQLALATDPAGAP